MWEFGKRRRSLSGGSLLLTRLWARAGSMTAPADAQTVVGAVDPLASPAF